MTTEEIALLKSSFEKIRPVAEQAAALFYARLFELDPVLRELFDGDLATQSRRLWQMLGFAVHGLEHLDTLAPAVRQFGLRHASYHVKQSHYDSIGEALLWTLSKGLGADFTFETRAAWGKIYWLLAEIMKAGARDGVASLNRAAA
jgi:hemoglobin-like flavoprotein